MSTSERDGFSMRDLLAACAAARTVSTPPVEAPCQGRTAAPVGGSAAGHEQPHATRPRDAKARPYRA
ncbi:hypothetical protein [Streptomyces longispororuber]|uniref:hypothetical protein n=1 Tax=Streptomyces longispororuber TaxID=68230 RepID=UPI00210AA17E|nr:hypothetical protein [Streptomyces longispororuber]MCQ4212439.1 hypothetical protein [Streptomyces longispororuber]